MGFQGLAELCAKLAEHGLAEYTPAAIVQPIVAAAPLLTIPFAALLEGARPRPRYYVGAALAVAGVAGLLVLR